MTTEYVELALSNGGVALIDVEDFEGVAPHHWHRMSNGYVACTLRPRGTMLLHRVVMQAPAHLHVDHINHDKLDNRRSNLRVVTRAENLQNRKGLDRNNTSGARGVSWDRDRGQWAARAHQNGRTFHLGRFADFDEAAAAARAWRLANMPGIVVDR